MTGTPPAPVPCRICGQPTLWGAVYCSRACKGAAQKTRPVRVCASAGCGHVFTARINRQGNRSRFCSRACANKSMAWKGPALTRRRWGALRKYTWSIDHPCCTRCGTTEIAHSAHGLCTRCERTVRHYRLYVPHPRPRVFRVHKESYEPLPLVWPYAPASVSLSDTSLLQQINRALPAHLREDTRADVGQMLVLAVLEGQIAPEDIAREVPRYLHRFYRENHGPWGARSIDAPIAGTDLYLRDVLAAPTSLGA